MGIAANEYLEFGSTGAIEYYKTEDRDRYFGENNLKAGDAKGIMFYQDGRISI